MKILITLVIIVASTCNRNQSPPEKFEVGIYFGSMCCGTADDSFLKPFIKEYSKQIRTYKIMGCGKEGEFRILFSAPDMPAKDLELFVTRLTELLQRQDSLNRASDPNIGGMNVERNLSKEDYEYCRLPMERWQ